VSNARLTVLISGRGSNLIAIDEACQSGQLGAAVTQVFCNEPAAAGIVYCQQRNIPVTVIDHREHDSRASFDRELVRQVLAGTPDLVLLAGFMRILSAEFIRPLEGRLLNIHPSLLPRYPGLDTHERAVADHQTWHGCSVHFVNEQLDGGPLIARSAVQLKGSIGSAETAATVLAREHMLYPFVIGQCLRGDIRLQHGQVMYHNRALQHPLLV